LIEPQRPSVSPHPDFSRIAIIGISGAGKTTLARQIASRTGSKHIELDALYWATEWQPKPPEEARALIRSAVAHERWVSDGNFSAFRDLVWRRATLIVWLDVSLHVALWQVLVRSLRRIASRTSLWDGNRETLLRTFFSRHSIVLWTLREHGAKRRTHEQLMNRGEWASLPWLVLRNRSDVSGLLAALDRHARKS